MALSKVPRSFTQTKTVCLTSCFQKRNWSDDLQYRPHVQERARSVTSFYNQSAIDLAAAKVSSKGAVPNNTMKKVFNMINLHFQFDVKVYCCSV